MSILNWCQFAITCILVSFASVALTKLASIFAANFARNFPWYRRGIAIEPLLWFDFRRAAPAAKVRLACRTFGVRFSISGPTLHRKSKEGFTALNSFPLSSILTLFYLPAASFIISIYLAGPPIRAAYESHFQQIPDRGKLYLAITFFIFSCFWWPLEFRRLKTVMGEESHRMAFFLCCRSIIVCHRAYQGKSTLLYLDRRIHRLGLALIRFGGFGIPLASPARRQQFLEHATRVSAALDARTERLFTDGTDAIPDLVKFLTGILERLADEKWLNIIDDHELPAYQQPSAEEMDQEVRKADGRVVLLGATAAAVMVGVLISIGVPAGAVIPGALIFLLGPATVWGSRKIGSPREMLDSIRGGVTQAAEPQPTGTTYPPANGSAAVPPSPIPASSAGPSAPGHNPHP
ncbi:hypothetical protein [Streptomyces phaeochromogenes]|uniref:hypothetical protein n=1 Tax=Streptomyces phaeochromogenes TaxID=1923 RepID=UPI00386B54B0|nr:hypothetical protein OHB08_05895 [Streptomyces phaeochromogenes]